MQRRHTAPAPGSLAGRIALIRRGTCGFYEKAFNAQSTGAIGVALYNNVAGRINPTVAGTPPITIPVVAITAADGVIVNDRIAAGPLSMTWTDDIVSDPQTTAGLMPSFSSFGVAPDLSLKPDIGAPGGAVRWTIPLEQGAHGPNSGTSMAAPHVAGAVVLLLEARPSLKARGLAANRQSSSVVWESCPRVPRQRASAGRRYARHRRCARLRHVGLALQAGARRARVRSGGPADHARPEPRSRRRS